MLTQAIAVILFIAHSAAAASECGFIADGAEMTIVVGKDANRCFSSPAFKDQFRANLIASVKTMEDHAPASVRHPRRPPGQKIRVLELPVQQAVLYYGQNPQR